MLSVLFQRHSTGWVRGRCAAAAPSEGHPALPAGGEALCSLLERLISTGLLPHLHSCFLDPFAVGIALP